MKALDLFCGLGGWSDGLAQEGFEVLGVELEEHVAQLYKHPVIVGDICELDPTEFMGYDLIVGSPPCRDFTDFAKLQALRTKGRWKKPADPEGMGMKLVNAFLNFVEVAQPTYWLMENVPRLREYLTLPPTMMVKLTKRGMKRCFWGNFPPFPVPQDTTKRKIQDIQGPLRSWERAKIPLPAARALGQAIVQSLESRAREVDK